MIAATFCLVWENGRKMFYVYLYTLNLKSISMVLQTLWHPVLQPTPYFYLCTSCAVLHHTHIRNSASFLSIPTPSSIFVVLSSPPVLCLVSCLIHGTNKGNYSTSSFINRCSTSLTPLLTLIIRCPYLMKEILWATTCILWFILELDADVFMAIPVLTHAVTLGHKCSPERNQIIDKRVVMAKTETKPFCLQGPLWLKLVV